MSLSRLFPTYQNSPKAKFGGNLLPSLLAQKLELFRIEARPGKAVVGVPANATIEMCIETSKGTGGLVVWFLPSRHREAAGSGLNSISLRIKCRHRVALGKHAVIKRICRECSGDHACMQIGALIPPRIANFSGP